MTSDVRLAEIVEALARVGVTCLVMGGHAVRFYGLVRNTNDFDLHLAPECWEDLTERLHASGLFPRGRLLEGPSWRPYSFRRFQIGVLPSGTEEWLEFWKENHLLPPFAELYARREMGVYGGKQIAFLSLPDLVRTKETERESDWQDVSVLEGFHDARLLALVHTGQAHLPSALSQLRSRRGFESHYQLGNLRDRMAVESAMQNASNSVTQAFLLPLVPQIRQLPPVFAPIERVVVDRLRTLEPGSTLHLALVEAVRRQYKLARQALDRADKRAIRDSPTAS